jgi:enterochelin esterase-like enzyme
MFVKKIYHILLVVILLFTLTSCANIGHPTIEYIDDNGNVQTESVSASNNRDYVKRIIKLLKSIQPKEYSYQVTSQIKQSFDCVLFEQGQNKKNIQFSFYSSDMLIYNHTNNITYNKIQSTKMIADKDLDSIYKKEEKQLTEYIYPDGYSYITENNNNIKVESSEGYLDNNIFYNLNIDIFNHIDEYFVDNYDLYISDCSKNNIKFCLDGKKLFNKDTKIFIYISPQNGLINKIYYEEKTLGLDILKSMFTETIILSEGLYGLEVRYNEITKRYDPLMFNKETIKSEVKTYNLTDEKNLPYSKNHKKVINVLLPPNYNKKKEYGLLIMLDSQNLYNNDVHNYTKLNDPYGGWQVDTTLEVLSSKYNKELIVVGLETTGYERMYELTESKEFGNVTFGAKKIFNDILEKGALDKTTNFIIETVIPFIKSKYYINDFIGIAGSSAGGNAAYYAAIKHSDIFKYSLPFSPAHTFFTDESLLNFHNENNYPNVPLYICCGKKGKLEKSLYISTKRFMKLMNKIGYTNIYTYYENTADHNEILWRYAFADAMDRVLKNNK